INGVATDAIAGQAVEGPLLVSSISGRVPEATGEVALGVKTMQLAHTAVGSMVQVTIPVPGGATRTSAFRVVGLASFPPDFGAVGLDRGAVFTIDGLVNAQCGTGPSSAACVQSAQQDSPYVLLVWVVPGAAGRAAVAGYLQRYPGVALAPLTPENLVNFGQAVNFPLILGLVLALFGAATVVHVLVVSVFRRRRELALLKSLGFVRRQVVASVCWQACTVAAVGIVVGVPLGLAAGRLLWQAFATNLGVVAVPVLPALSTVLLCLGALAAANLLAIGPAFVSARARAALILRTE
ncbi:MAG TPA: FtsX-like permease family protein, partial [Actinomycetota bacterium]|nr:FtsX-like permease family protein [Actinomycetota bacterium]